MENPSVLKAPNLSDQPTSLRSRARLPKRSWAKISQIRTLSVQRLKKKVGKASAVEVDQIVEVLDELIGGAPDLERFLWE